VTNELKKTGNCQLYSDSYRDLVIIGRVIEAHGLYGEIKIEPISNVVDRFSYLRTVILELKNGECCLFKVDYAKNNGVHIITKLNGIDTRDDAERFKNAYVSVTRDNVAPLGNNSYYIFDLEGLEVYKENNTKIGFVEKVEEYPANDVLIINTECEKIMVPAVKSYVIDVDLKAKKIIVSLSDGLPAYPKRV
jgi:16S rRNA processing protein RimM